MVRFATFFLLVFGASASAQVSSQTNLGGGRPPASRASVVTVNVAGSGVTIPSNFLGFSIEAGDLVNGYYQGTTGTAASFINLVKLLGANGVFRVGGLTADQVTPPALTQNIANNYQAFLAAIGAGWTNPVFYTLDLTAASTSTATTHAGFLANAFGASAMTFAFGNEPFTAGNFSFGSLSTYQTAWNAYYTAVTGAVSGASYAAWDDGDLQDASAVITGLTPGIAGLSSVTMHYYYFDAFHTGLSAAALLSSVPTSIVGISSGFAGSKQRMTETNSIASSGKAGISDRMASAAWFLSYAARLAAAGTQGVNIHNHYPSAQQPLPGIYNPAVPLANNNFGPGAIFYGMFLFSKIVGQQIVPSSVGGNGNVAAIATKGSGGNANIIAVNNDASSPVTVTPVQSSAWTTANVLQIKSPTGIGCSEASPTVGGQAIGESGAWSGAPFAISSGQGVTLGPCEAVLIQIQP